MDFNQVKEVKRGEFGQPLLSILAVFTMVFGAASEGVYAQAAVTLDFQSQEHSGNGFTSIGLVYTEKNFMVANGGGLYGFGCWGTDAGANYTGSTGLFNNSTNCYTNVSRADGGYFDFLGIDLAESSYFHSGTITFLGYRDATMVVTESFTVDGVAGVQRFIPTKSFVDLSEIRWLSSYPYPQFDNISLLMGRSGNGPQITITGVDSIAHLLLSHVVPGKSYTLEKSSDLTAWTTLQTFTPYLSIEEHADFAYQQSKMFYRLRWSP